jgi:hypothetical protein
MTERHRSRALKSERPWGEPTCPLNPPQRMRERFQNGVKGVTDLGEAKTLHAQGTGITGRACHPLDARKQPILKWFSGGFPKFPSSKARGDGDTVLKARVSRCVTVPIMPKRRRSYL